MAVLLQSNITLEDRLSEIHESVLEDKVEQLEYLMKTIDSTDQKTLESSELLAIKQDLEDDIEVLKLSLVKKVKTPGLGLQANSLRKSSLTIV